MVQATMMVEEAEEWIEYYGRGVIEFPAVLHHPRLRD